LDLRSELTLLLVLLLLCERRVSGAENGAERAENRLERSSKNHVESERSNDLPQSRSRSAHAHLTSSDFESNASLTVFRHNRLSGHLNNYDENGDVVVVFCACVRKSV